MKKYLGGWVPAVLVMGLMDAVWIGWLARSLYQEGLGHLMAPQVNMLAALAFYLIYGMGVVIFAVAPGGASSSWGATACRGALFGFFAYTAYDLTNLATLRDWPWALSLIDMAWGSVASLAAAVAGKAGFDQFSGVNPCVRTG